MLATLWRFYAFSLFFTLICLGLGAWHGWTATGTITGTLSLLWIIVVLSVLEISLSFDNAVVNASVLKEMDEVWQRRFGQPATDAAGRAKQMRFLAGRGFAGDVIRRVVQGADEFE